MYVLSVDTTNEGILENLGMLFVIKTEVMRQLGKPRHSWMNNIKMGLFEMGSGGMDRIGLVHDWDW
jgi:hypothetical protein